MKVAIVNFADSQFLWSQNRLNDAAKKKGIDKIFSWQHSDFIKTKFYKNNFEILSQPRGLGFWLWKPYILLEAMKELENGDILIYCDSGIEIIDKLNPLIRICTEKSDIVCFNNCDYHNAIWTKRDCFVRMSCDEEKYWNGRHIEGAFQLYKKSKIGLTFIEEWLEYGKDRYIITDEPNVSDLPNFPEFRDSRHDQSILSLLTIKHNLEIFRCPSQFGNHYKHPDFRVENEFKDQNHFISSNSYSEKYFINSAYGTLLNHHRTKKTPGFFERLMS